MKPPEVITTLKLPLPEQIIAGRYRILSRLGSGGMGLVFLAEQLSGGTKVALKFLDPEPNDDDSRVTRFLREAKVGIAVQHPNATQVLDLGLDEGNRLFVAFEHVEGEDLREVLKREGRLRWAEAHSITRQVASVLAFAHERGIVHRDIKPENLRVRREGGATHVKLLDFGIARLLKDSGVRITAEGTLAGTPRYMAPEQVNDDPLDGRVDQYALGLVFYEMLTGAVAVGGKTVTQILTHQLQTPVPPLAWADPELGHEAVDAFIARACAKAPRERFASMGDFIAALEALPVDERSWPLPKPGLAAPVGSVEPTREGPGSGLSDTFVRPAASTEVRPRDEVPTDPHREPVARRNAEPTAHRAPGDASAPARTAPPSPEPRTEVVPALERSGHAVAEAPAHLELPTLPERPAVPRRPAPIRQTVRGDAKPAPARRWPWWPWVLISAFLALALASAAAWWRGRG